MSLSDMIMSALQHIKSGAPQLRAIDQEIESVETVVASVVPAAAPVIAAVEAAQALVDNVLVDLTQSASLTQPATPAQPTAPAAPDPAAIAAANIASSAQQSPELAQRIAALENMAQITAPLLSKLANHFGL